MALVPEGRAAGGIEEGCTSGKTRVFFTPAGSSAQRERTSPSSAGTLLYRHADHPGSVSLATGTSGMVTARQDDTPYGERRGTADITQTPSDYMGQRLDQTRLLFDGARSYDLALAGCLSPDAAAPDHANPRRPNRSRCAGNQLTGDTGAAGFRPPTAYARPARHAAPLADRAGPC